MGYKLATSLQVRKGRILRLTEVASYSAINAQSSLYNLRLPKISIELFRKNGAQNKTISSKSRPSSISNGAEANRGRILTDRRPKTSQGKLSICTVGESLQNLSIPGVAARTSRVPSRPLSARPRPALSTRIPAADREGKRIMILELPQHFPTVPTPATPPPAVATEPTSAAAPPPKRPSAVAHDGADATERTARANLLLQARPPPSPDPREAGPLPTACVLGDAGEPWPGPGPAASPVWRPPETIPEGDSDGVDGTLAGRVPAEGSSPPQHVPMGRPSPPEGQRPRVGPWAGRLGVQARRQAARARSLLLVPTPPRSWRGAGPARVAAGCISAPGRRRSRRGWRAGRGWKAGATGWRAG